MIVQMIVFTGAARAAAPDAELRPDRRTLRARARVQCRRRWRSAARRGASPPARTATADRLRVGREPAGVSDDRARHSLLPHALAPARSLSLAPRRPAPRRCTARRPGADDGAVPRWRGLGAIARGLGRHAPWRLLRRVRDGAGDQRPRGRGRRLSLPLQPQRQRAPPHPDGALHGRPRRLAYAVRDGIPIVAQLFGADGPEYSGTLRVLLDGLVLLPAFGLVYAVGVAHVLGTTNRAAAQPAGTRSPTAR